jgi:hypothetical protein
MLMQVRLSRKYELGYLHVFTKAQLMQSSKLDDTDLRHVFIACLSIALLGPVMALLAIARCCNLRITTLINCQ